jgi:hypothetical protein
MSHEHVAPPEGIQRFGNEAVPLRHGQSKQRLVEQLQLVGVH